MGVTTIALFRKVFKPKTAVRDIYCMTSIGHMGNALAGGVGVYAVVER